MKLIIDGMEIIAQPGQTLLDLVKALGLTLLKSTTLIVQLFELCFKSAALLLIFFSRLAYSITP